LNKCKYTETCPVYSGELKSPNLTTAMFKRNYCETGTDSWGLCRRYQVAELGSEPADIMPHDPRDAEDIAKSLDV